MEINRDVQNKRAIKILRGIKKSSEAFLSPSSHIIPTMCTLLTS